MPTGNTPNQNPDPIICHKNIQIYLTINHQIDNLIAEKRLSITAKAKTSLKCEISLEKNDEKRDFAKPPNDIRAPVIKAHLPAILKYRTERGARNPENKNAPGARIRRRDRKTRPPTRIGAEDRDRCRVDRRRLR